MNTKQAVIGFMICWSVFLSVNSLIQLMLQEYHSPVINKILRKRAFYLSLSATFLTSVEVFLNYAW